MHHLRVPYDIDDMTASGSSGSGDFDAGLSNNRGLKDLHIIIIAVGAFVTLCFTLTCLVSPFTVVIQPAWPHVPLYRCLSFGAGRGHQNWTTLNILPCRSH